jgi:DNA-binding transcriptional MerR regulator
MTRKEVLDKLYSKGITVMPYTIDYLVSTRKLQSPRLDSSRRRIFTAKDVKTIAKLLQSRDAGQG